MAKIVIDGTRTQTLRTVILSAFAGVAVVLIAMFGLHELKRRGFSLDLPGRLGVNISQTASGYTYSQSSGGHTLFTIHASKIVEFKNNQAELRDVAITLYGPPGSNRKDRISGSDFQYDRKAGIVTAKGSVEIDMASPATSPAGAANKNAAPDTIHVKTSGVRFNQATGVARTDDPLAFTLPRASGKAVGGSYNSKSGVLVLQSQVELHADENGNPAVIDAQHAQLVRDAHVAYLLRAASQYQGGRESADQATVHFRPDGSLEHLDAQGHVHILTQDGAELFSSTASSDFDTHGQPLTSYAGGGVNFLSNSPDSSMHGNAVEGTMSFIAGPDGKASLHHAHFDNAVSFVLLQRSLGGDPRGSSTREMTASALDVDFALGPGGKSLAQRAIAKGGAMVNLHDLPYGAPPRHTSIFGAQLTTLLANGHQLRQLDGTGGTKVVRYAPDGATDTTTGDLLHVTFATAGLPKGQKQGGESADVQTAEQQGHVTMVEQPAPGAKNSDGTTQQPLYADAAVGVFQASTQMLRLTGDARQQPRVHNATMALTGDVVVYNRATGDAQATGDVRSTYLQTPGAKTGLPTRAPGLGGSGAVHVVAAAAQMARSTQAAVFDGSAKQPARLWQGANSVLAPVIELGKQQGTLNAHGAGGARSDAQNQAVHTVFTGHGQNGGMAITRVASQTLFYSDSTRTGDFHGDVVAQQPNGTVHARDAQVFLTETPPGQSAQLERMVATGDVVLTQPGRRGTGSRLVYTAADGNYLLTGDPGKPPHATDAQRGETTGAELLLRGSDNGVEVLNHDAEGNGRRTVTDTRTPK